MAFRSNDPSNRPDHFNSLYDEHVKRLQLQGLRSKTIDAYSRAIRRIGDHFDYTVDNLTEGQLLDYFSALLKSHSFSTLKLDLYGLKFFYLHTLKRDWKDIPLVKSPRVKVLPDVLSTDEVMLLFSRTRVLSYRIFFYTTYSLGLRLGESLSLEVGDIDRHKMQVHIRKGKGGKDRFVPLPDATLKVLRQFWNIHRHPRFLFPNRKKSLAEVALVTKPLDRGGVQKAMVELVKDCGFKKKLPSTACATATPPTCWKKVSTCVKSKVSLDTVHCAPRLFTFI